MLKIVYTSTVRIGLGEVGINDPTFKSRLEIENEKCIFYPKKTKFFSIVKINQIHAVRPACKTG